MLEEIRLKMLLIFRPLNNDVDITMTRNMLFMVEFYETLNILFLSIVMP